jgi:hypothetical protein
VLAGSGCVQAATRVCRLSVLLEASGPVTRLGSQELHTLKRAERQAIPRSDPTRPMLPAADQQGVTGSSPVPPIVLSRCALQHLACRRSVELAPVGEVQRELRQTDASGAVEAASREGVRMLIPTRAVGSVDPV